MVRTEDELRPDQSITRAELLALLSEEQNIRSCSEVLRAAAQEWGLSHSTLYRLVRPTTSKRISWTTVRALRRALKPPEARKLDSGLFTESMAGYLLGLEQECGRLKAGRDDLDTLHLRGKVRREVECFAAMVRRGGFPPERDLLARLRVFDPIMALRRAGGRKHLTTTLLARLVWLGYRRERLLLGGEKGFLRDR